jgi:hypothetical protein
VRLVRQHRPDGSPFKVGEFVAHDSKFQFGSLNHDPAADLNIAHLRAAASPAVEGLLLGVTRKIYARSEPYRV